MVKIGFIRVKWLVFLGKIESLPIFRQETQLIIKKGTIKSNSVATKTEATHLVNEETPLRPTNVENKKIEKT